jgi:hypothetical protein
MFSVTGHMDIPEKDHDLIRNKIKDLFLSYRKRYPNTKLILITPLAEGADRIAAKAATDAGVMLAPVLPMDIRRYEGTLGGSGDKDASMKEFYELMNGKASYSPIELPSDNKDDPDCYRNLAAYMIATSHIMIALWDGRRYTGNIAGGTYDTLRMACKGVDEDLHEMTHPMSPVKNTRTMSREVYLNVTEDCLVYHIEVDRLAPHDKLKEKGCLDLDHPPKNLSARYIVPHMVAADIAQYEINNGVSAPDNDDGTEPFLGPTRDGWNTYGDLPDYFDNMFSRLNEMNRDMGITEGHGIAEGSIVSDICSGTSQMDSRMYDDLLGSDTPGTSEIKDSGLMYDMVLRMKVADRLAMKYQTTSFSNIRKSIVLGLISAAFLQFYFLFGGAALIIALYSVSLVVAILFFRKHKSGKIFSKFIEYRLLAESMRVGCYWGMLGINDSTESICYGYMKNDMMWAKAILSAWGSYILNDYDRINECSEEQRDGAGRYWIEGQKKYHKRKKEKNRRKSAKYGRYMMVVERSMLVISVAAFVLSMISLGEEILGSIGELMFGGIVLMFPEDVTTMTLVRVMLAVLSIVTAAIAVYSDKMLHGGSEQNMEAKYRMFDIADERINIAKESLGKKDPERFLDVKLHIYYELGVQCINETNDWAFEHMNKDMDAPENNILQSDGAVVKK